MEAGEVRRRTSKERVQAFFGIETAKARGGAPRILLNAPRMV